MRQRLRRLILMGALVLWAGWGLAAESDLVVVGKGVTQAIMVV